MRNLINEIVQKSAQGWLGKMASITSNGPCCLLVVCIKCGHFLPVFRYVENSNERHRLDAELSLQQQEWEKQEKILQTFKATKSDSRQLSPELANSVLPINQHVQALLNGRLRALDLRWDFFLNILCSICHYKAILSIYNNF